MAKMQSFVIKVEDFLTQTRVSICDFVNCLHYDGELKSRCNLKTIVLHDGECVQKDEIEP